jgi:hypothetical protein
MISLATPLQPSGLQSFTSPDSFRFDINELNQHLGEASGDAIYYGVDATTTSH